MSANKTDVAAVPRYHELMWPTITALRSLGGSATNQEINDAVIEIAGLTDTQLHILHGQGPMTEVAYRLHWARTYLKSADAVTNTSRGVWAITEKGQSLSEQDVVAIPRQVRANSRLARQLRAASAIDDGGARVDEVDIQNDTTFTSIEASQWHEFLLKTMLDMSPSSFERLCQRILREAGFTNVEVTGRTGDGGIDGIGVLRVALLSFHVFFQCKRYRGSVGASAIRDFRGAMVGRTDKGLFITTGSFTPDAVREATRDGAPVLDLIDGEALCSLVKDHSLGVTTRMVEEVTIEGDWFRTI